MRQPCEVAHRGVGFIPRNADDARRRERRLRVQLIVSPGDLKIEQPSIAQAVVNHLRLRFAREAGRRFIFFAQHRVIVGPLVANDRPFRIDIRLRRAVPFDVIDADHVDQRNVRRPLNRAQMFKHVAAQFQHDQVRFVHLRQLAQQ